MLGKSLKRYVGFPTVLVVCLCRRLVGCWFFLVFFGDFVLKAIRVAR